MITMGAVGGGRSSRRGGCGRGGMAALGLVVGGWGVGEVVARMRGRERTVSGVDDHAWAVPCA